MFNTIYELAVKFDQLSGQLHIIYRMKKNMTMPSNAPLTSYFMVKYVSDNPLIVSFIPVDPNHPDLRLAHQRDLSSQESSNIHTASQPKASKPSAIQLRRRKQNRLKKQLKFLSHEHFLTKKRILKKVEKVEKIKKPKKVKKVKKVKKSKKLREPKKSTQPSLEDSDSEQIEEFRDNTIGLPPFGLSPEETQKRLVSLLERRVFGWDEKKLVKKTQKPIVRVHYNWL